MSENVAWSIMEALWRLNRNFCSDDYDKSLDFLQKILPFTIHEYKNSTPHKGWAIPPHCNLIKGEIKLNNEVVYSADHPLKLIGLSAPFKGNVSFEELKEHLHFDKRDPSRIPFHFRQFYRPWERDWGFCVSENFLKTLKPACYDVEIVTEEKEGTLKVAEYVHEGLNQAGFVFVAHLDHPGMANDDLAGVAVAVEFFKKLSQHKTKFSWRLVLVQEMIGSVYFLDHTLKDPSKCVEGCFLEMLGSRTPLALQHSRGGATTLERTLKRVIEDLKLPFNEGPFRSIVCNDEAIWESAGIPMCSLSRYPYPEYHSDHDNLSIIDKGVLNSSAQLLLETALLLDKMTLIEKKFTGTYALSHPDYNLYVDPGQPAFQTKASSPALRKLMDEMPLLPAYTFAETLSGDLGLPLEETLDYLKLWEKKGLVSLI